TVIKSLIKAIEKAHGSGTSFKLLAPTGKAADRIRSKTGKDAVTIHSFLAKLGWLNPNMTFKRSGGKREEQAQTIIVDESSMLDLELMTTLFRAINWSAVQRLILVGDPNQLPPIGRGKCFAEIINYLKQHQPESYAELKINIRQMENRVFDRGAAILELASVYQRASVEEEDDEETKAAAEELLKRVQDGGDVDKDLRVVYWNDPETLSDVLIKEMVRDMERDSGESLNPDRPFDLWKKACETDGGNGYKRQRAEYNQVISPYRGELFGTEPLNEEIQKHIKGIPREEQPDFNRQLDGVMLFDKVIQITNRSLSNREPVYGYNPETKTSEKVEVFNGELGYVKPHGFDGKKWMWDEFQLKHLQVQFERKKHWVGYGSKLGKDKDDKWIPEAKVENNLELAYAISVHKSQGSEFYHVYFIVPKHKDTLLSPELFYTGITRASKHCTLLIQEDIGPLLNMRRRERSHLVCINSSIFEFAPIPEVMLNVQAWYEEGKIHETLSEFVVRSKSEVIITNMLAEREVLFRYEEPLFASDGTFYLPDFTITWNGDKYFWEHWGRLDQGKYRNHTEVKKKWYEKHFPGRLVETFEGTDVTTQANQVIAEHFSV
ncbi:MAG: ATP-dependent RecD-like DNA helicase, partial [Planctomycetaceae bacterium]|nr:ATP-dependent RecD-like DNA helicase [Planctomycetaceae bacterium]